MKRIKRHNRRKEFMVWYVQFPVIMLTLFMSLFWLAVLL